jgi:hypothetical protein
MIDIPKRNFSIWFPKGGRIWHSAIFNSGEKGVCQVGNATQ